MPNSVPEGWRLVKIDELFTRLSVPRAHDRKSCSPQGNTPILDQSEDDWFGKHEGPPDLDASESFPLVTFANHTCAVRFHTRPFSVIQNVFPLRANEDVSPMYLYSVLEKAVPQDGYRGHWPEVKRLRFPKPPLSEQRKIAAILSSVDGAIQATEAVIAQTRRVKEGLLQELLTKGIGHTRFKKTAIGEIPEGWEVVELQNLIEDGRPICYGILMPGKMVSGGVPVVKVRDIVNGEINTANLLLTSSDIDAAYTRSKLRENDVLLTIRGTTGRVAIVPPSLEDANITQDTARLTVNQTRTTSLFVFFYLESSQAQRYINLHTIGQAVKGINIGEVKRIPIALPPIQEQQQIVEIVSANQTQASIELTKLAALKQTKAGLLQDLLTGKVRVTN